LTDVTLRREAYAMSHVRFEPTDLAHVDDPYPLLATVRQAGPVVRLQSGFWAVTG